MMINQSNLWKCAKYTFRFSGESLIMGIVNVTPDSFSDGGLYVDPEDAIAHGLSLVEEGAHILDIGGESTRPFSTPVSRDDELKRVLPVIEGLAKRVDIPLSIDTYKADIAERAIDAGASIVNDISAGTFDPQMLPLVAKKQVGLVLMHMKGTPQNMQVNPAYSSVVSEIIAFLEERVQASEAAGIKREYIAVDPGIGFGKNLDHNLKILKHLHFFHALECTVLIGPSRKRFIGEVLGIEEPSQRVLGTQAVLCAGAMAGVQVMRVHDVAQARQTLTMTHAIMNA